MKLGPSLGLDRALRRVLPRSLLGRSLLIVLVPLLLVEAVALQIFYGSHLDVLSRRLAGGVSGEVSFMLDQIDRHPAERREVLGEAWQRFEFRTRIIPGAKVPALTKPMALGPVDQDLEHSLAAHLRHPFAINWFASLNYISIDIAQDDGVLQVDVPRKRLYVGQLYIFFAWLGGSSLVLFGIAALFLRNQVRGIRRLASAAEDFGMGRESGLIKPEGAVEVRRAAAAFNRMQDRIGRFLTQRTAMLAGVSHDLRTPLTRLRLALAMLPEDAAADVAGMTGDIEEMEKLVDLYLAFARGEGTEQPQLADLSALLGELAAKARHGDVDIECRAPEALSLSLRPDAMRRAIRNLIDNACRFATIIRLTAGMDGERSVRITIDDNGPGIPANRREAVFRPFETGTKGGTGLGLAITRDIISAHGGDIYLADSPLGGLRVSIILPA